MSTATRPAAPSAFATVSLVAGREISTRLRSKSFIISTAILMLAVLASVVIGGLVSQNAEPPKVAVVGTAATVLEGLESGLTTVEASDQAEAEQLLRDGKVSAVVMPSSDADAANGITVIGLDAAPSTVISALSISPEVQILEPASQDGFLVYLVGLAFGIVFFMSALTFGQTIALSVVEEKQTRVVEILMATISVRTLLAGKVIGNSVMAFGQIVAIGALAAIGMLVTGQKVLLTNMGAPLAWFVVFFALGFVLLATLFAATASMVSRSEDIGTATSPITMLVMLPYILVIAFSSNETVMAIMSYVPFSAPVGMPMRVFLGTAEWWEPLLSLLILVISTLLVLALGSRIYSNSLLRMGTRVKLGEALRG